MMRIVRFVAKGCIPKEFRHFWSTSNDVIRYHHLHSFFYFFLCDACLSNCLWVCVCACFLFVFLSHFIFLFPSLSVYLCHSISLFLSLSVSFSLYVLLLFSVYLSLCPWWVCLCLALSYLLIISPSLSFSVIYLSFLVV